MTVSNTTNNISYDVTSSQTTFSYTFKIFNSSDLRVYLDGTLTTNYTVTDVGENSGTIVLNTAVSTGTVFIERILDLTQGVDYVENDAFPAETHEAALDKLTFIAQQLSAEHGTSIRVAPGSGNLPVLTGDRANKYLGFNNDGDVIVTAGTTESVTHSTLGVSIVQATDAQSVRDDIDVYSKAQTDTEISDSTTTLGNSKQDTLVSSTNIKTINGSTLLGEGNITTDTGRIHCSKLPVIAQSTQSNSGVVMSDGSIQMWGNQTAYYQIPVGQYDDDKGLPTTIAFPYNSPLVSKLYINHECGYSLMTDGSVYAWGSNSTTYGSLGLDSTAASINVPTKITFPPGTVITKISISSGYTDTVHSAYALDSDGKVFAWGDNTYSQLGDGTETHQKSPVRVKDPDGNEITGATDIYSTPNGQYTRLFVTHTGGEVSSCGYNASSSVGSLGDNTSVSTNSKTSKLPGWVLKSPNTTNKLTGITKIISHTTTNGTTWGGGTMFLAAGKVYYCGYNAQYQSSTPPTTGVTNYALEIPSISALTQTVVDIAMSPHPYSSQAIILSDGTCRMWGENTSGQLGVNHNLRLQEFAEPKDNDNNTINNISKILFGGNGYEYGTYDTTYNGTSISYQNVGITTTYILTTDGVIYASGYNLKGQCGQGHLSYLNRFHPIFGIKFGGVDDVDDMVTVGENELYGLLVLKKDGTLYGLGSGYLGQLGNEDPESAANPTLRRVKLEF